MSRLPPSMGPLVVMPADTCLLVSYCSQSTIVHAAHVCDPCRLSSNLFPWGDSGKYSLEELPDLPQIKEVLAEVGILARLYKQRITSHPSEFVKMAAQKEDVVFKSLWDLELHSKVGICPE